MGRRRDERQKILIVDDEACMQQYFLYMLDDIYKIVTASSGSEAVACVKSSMNFDLVIIDYRLPDISGIDLLIKLKSAIPSTPIILATAYGNEEIVARAFRNGVADYIKKPFTCAELLQKVEFYITQKTSGQSKKKFIEFEVCNEKAESLLGTGAHNYYKIQKAIKYIGDNYMMDITLKTVANIACMSRFYFSRIFKKVTGRTYQDYLLFLRIEKAKALLTRNHYSITDVACAVGYSDITHFGRIFKRLSGHTPSKYKIIHKSDAG